MQSDDARSDDLLPVLPPELTNLPKPSFSYDKLLPRPQQDLRLTDAERDELAAYKASLVILGPAGGAVLKCPGNRRRRG
jgi:hypothetical protein